MTTVDRTGWGESPAPEDYRNTSIAEQAIAVAGAAGAPGPGEVASAGLTVAGFDIGGVIAFEFGLANPGLVDRVVMIDPPLFGTLPEATAGISADVEAIRDAVEREGEEAAYELFLSGALSTLGAGAERLGVHADRGPEAPRSFLVEIPAVPAWSLDPVRLDPLSGRVTVASTATAPAVVTDAARAFALRLDGSEAIRLGTDGPASLVELL